MPALKEHCLHLLNCQVWVTKIKCICHAVSGICWQTSRHADIPSRVHGEPDPLQRKTKIKSQKIKHLYFSKILEKTMFASRLPHSHQELLLHLCRISEICLVKRRGCCNLIKPKKDMSHNNHKTCLCKVASSRLHYAASFLVYERTKNTIFIYY